MPGLNFIDLKCTIGEKIRVLSSYYGVTSQCQSSGGQSGDCKSFTDQFESFCNGRSECNIEFLKIYLPKCRAYSSYLTVRYECVPGSVSKKI